jgi:hypothetical protein
MIMVVMVVVVEGVALLVDGGSVRRADLQHGPQGSHGELEGKEGKERREKKEERRRGVKLLFEYPRRKEQGRGSKDNEASREKKNEREEVKQAKIIVVVVFVGIVVVLAPNK